MSFWLSHRTWSRRYGLEDGVSIFLSLLLVFVLLVCIYPLRMVFSAFFAWASGGWLPTDFELQTRGELLGLFIIYGAAFACLTLILAMLYNHAWRKRDRLSLSSVEKAYTLEEMTLFFIAAGTGLTSVLFASLLPENLALLSGFTYATLPISMPLTSSRFKKRAHMLLIAEQQRDTEVAESKY